MPDLLSAVVRATSTAPDTDVLLDRVAQLLTARADWVLADRLDEPDMLTRVAAYGASGPLALPPGMGPASSRRSAAGSVGLLPAVLRAPDHVLTLDAAQLGALCAAPEPHLAAQARMAISLGARALLVLGLVARENLVGVLSLPSRQPVPEEHLAELRDIAAHVGLALDAARLLAVQGAVSTALQTSLLPPLPSVPGLRLAARYTPAARGLDVGGDWYDAFDTPTGLCVVIGDASGHDVAAAARMADLRNLLRAHAVDRDEAPPETVARLERTAERLGLDATATCLLARLSPTGAGPWQLRWTSAGHLPPVLLHAGHAALLETSADLMLGVERGAVRSEHRHRLDPGDLLLLYTDGLVEVRGEPLEDRLELLRRTVQQHSGQDPDALAETLLHQLAARATDDVALLVLQVREQPTGSCGNP